MTTAQSKVMKIMDEMFLFFNKIDSMDTTIHMKETEQAYIITATGDFTQQYSKDLEHLQHALVQAPNPGLEEAYWGLSGMVSYHDNSELQLIANMVSKGICTVSGDKLTVVLHRNKE